MAQPIGAVNWYGLYTLTAKEIGRFMKVGAQTIVAPLIMAVLYYAVFALALPQHTPVGPDISFVAFIVPGLVMMSMLQNAFANTISSLVISKVQGNIVDVLMPPLSPAEFVVGYVVGGIVRGLVVGAVCATAFALLVGVSVYDGRFIIFYAVFGSMLFALLGLIGGIWAEKFDHMATVQNFVVMPATFLSGTFFAADQLPSGWRLLCELNPVFYIIDGFRYGFIGEIHGPAALGIGFVLGSNLVLVVVAWLMVRSGYKLKM